MRSSGRRTPSDFESASYMNSYRQNPNFRRALKGAALQLSEDTEITPSQAEGLLMSKLRGDRVARKHIDSAIRLLRDSASLEDW
jgi:hypothetical protein